MMSMKHSFKELGVHAIAGVSALGEPILMQQPNILTKRTNTPWQVRCIQGHIAANMNRAIRMADLGRIVNFSSYRIKRVFKDNFGCSPHQYLMRRRVARAQSLLSISDDPLSRIAAECGFASESHLNKVFRKVVGEPPGRWRRCQRRQSSDRLSQAIRTR